MGTDITIATDYFFRIHEGNHSHIQRQKLFNQLKCHMVGMSKEVLLESYDRVMVPSLEERYKQCGTIAISSVPITLKADFLCRIFFLLLFKLSQGNSDLE